MFPFSAGKKHGGGRTYAVSQFYCGEEVLATWLNALGAGDLFDGIYVSCDHGASKRRGTLYKFLLKELSLDGRDVVMIGDNRHSDYVMAKRNGLAAYHAKHREPRKSKQLKRKKKYGANVFELERIAAENAAKSELANFAFPLYLFTKRLCDELEEKNIPDILFYAREGKFFKRLFEIYRNATGRCANVRSHYFLISRNAIATASLAPLGEEQFRYIVHNSFLSMQSANTFLVSLGFSPERIDELQRRLKFNFKRTYIHFYATEKYKSLLQDELFQTTYEALRTERKEGFAAYLQTFPVDYRNGAFCVVDVGWKGLMQDLMRKHLGGTDFPGYYLGMADKTKEGAKRKFGLLYSLKSGKYRYHHYFWRYRMLYEQICRADHGHADAYALKDGKPEVLLDGDHRDEELFEKKFKPLQDMIASTFMRICALDFEKYSQMENIIMRTYYHSVTHMKRRDYIWQLDAEDCHYDSFVRVGYRLALVGRGLRTFAYRVSDAFFALRALPYRNRARVRFTSPKTYRR